MKSKFLNITISILSFFVGIYILEISLNFYIENKNSVSIHDKVTELDRKQQKPVTIIYPYQNLKLIGEDSFSLAGISNRITVLCSEEKRWSIYKSDRFGFRNNDKIWNNQNINYLFLGDSFTQGACVEDHNTTSENLVKKHNGKINIINLGYGGTGPLYQYAILKEYYPEKKIEKVLWFFFEGNDLSDLKIELKSKKLNKYLNIDNFQQNLKLKQSEIDKILLKNFKKNIKPKLKKNFLIQTIKISQLRNFFKNYINFNKDIKFDYKEYKEILIKANNFVKNKNSELILVYIPIYTRYYGDDNNLNSIYKKIKEISKELNINFIDIVKEFDHLDAQDIYYAEKSNKHFSIKGYKFLSKILYEKLN